MRGASLSIIFKGVSIVDRATRRGEQISILFLGFVLLMLIDENQFQN